MVFLSEHQQKPCVMCEEDSNKYNHCSWCGKTFKTFDKLSKHLDESDCTAEQFQALLGMIDEERD
jgi:hypothetical protein